MTRRALLIVNTKSRRGEEALSLASSELRARDIEIEHRDCDSRSALETWIGERAAHNDLIVVCGGDGTLNFAANALIAAQRPVGILPFGTANDLARTLQVPADIAAALDIIAAGHTSRVDVGRVNGKPFFNVASIGVSVALAESLTPIVKRRWGRLAYAFAALRVLFSAKPFHANVVSETGRQRVYTLQIAVGNGRFYGGGNIVVHDARIDDGKLHAYSLEFARVWRIALMLRSFREGRHVLRPEVRELKGVRFEVSTRRPRSINADGELITRTPAVFELSPQALEFFVPDAPPALGPIAELARTIGLGA